MPEILFGLFPGMGAYSILARRLGSRMAERLLMEGRVYTAEEMYDMGLVNVVAEPGEGEAAVRDYILANRDRHVGHVGIYQAGRRVNALTLDELRDIVDSWVETALRLTDKDIRMMRRLAAAQTRLHRR